VRCHQGAEQAHGDGRQAEPDDPFHHTSQNKDGDDNGQFEQVEIHHDQWRRRWSGARRNRVPDVRTIRSEFVRFGSKADICSANRYVRFGPKADIKSARRCYRFDVVKLPRLVEVSLRWGVKTEVREPSLAGIGLYPVSRACRFLRTEEYVYRAV